MRSNPSMYRHTKYYRPHSASAPYRPTAYHSSSAKALLSPFYSRSFVRGIRRQSQTEAEGASGNNEKRESETITGWLGWAWMAFICRLSDSVDRPVQRKVPGEKWRRRDWA
ncbi:hypothetical protein BCR39DRAFT_524742 [Naematelia encephala]|uniref:Uncharacterized protein n=1 Tax=Naematelia encephala TaxID=71784 RepID=A0A1Y2BAS3_9TREE|nr:hypothetical protein BCR39DRAFT_524742 [Naematelia encephala]